MDNLHYNACDYTSHFNVDKVELIKDYVAVSGSIQ